MTCTTMVRSGCVFLGWLGVGGWGTSAASPCGVSGVMTIKMMSSTSITYFIGVLHLVGVIYFGQVNRNALLQHGRDHHEDDQQHQHHVHHGRHVDVGVDLRAFVSY